MRVSKVVGDFRAKVIAGTHTVLIALDCEPERRNGLLGFAFKREVVGAAKDGPKWLRSLKVFKSIVPNPQDEHDPQDPTQPKRFSTLEHPIQSFLWGDYTALPDTLYRFTIVPMYGQPGALEPKAELTFEVRTEKELDQGHGVWFNRGAIASQAFAREFENKAPTDQQINDPKAKETAWLSRGLLEACLANIDGTPAGDGLRVAAYEFTYEPVLLALKAALDRGVDVRIIYHDTTVDDGPGENEKAIVKAALPDKLGARQVLFRRTKAKIPHNKFIVRLEGGKKPTRVWTGSTNFTPSGFLGQTNVGHLVDDAATAKQYLAFWEILKKDPDRDTARVATMKLTPDPPALIALKSIVQVFSPRPKDFLLTWYGDRILNATGLVMFTAAFGVTQKLVAPLAIDRDFLRFILMEKPPTDKIKAELTKDRDCIIGYGSVLGEMYTFKDGKPVARRKIKEFELDKWLLVEDHFRHDGFVFFVHTKFLLIDPLSNDPLVCSGSANFSPDSLLNNDENMLLIRGDTRVADIYLSEFDRIFRHFYFRDIANELAAKGGKAKGVFLDETSKWTDSYFKPGAFKTRRRELFFADDTKSWVVNAEKFEAESAGKPKVAAKETTTEHHGHDKAHPVGSGVGAAAGAATGAAVGTVVGGPTGILVGAAVGAVAGGLVGHGIAESINPSEEDAYWRENYRSRPYVDANRSYDDYQPAYKYGLESYGRYAGERFEDVESDLERGWDKGRGASRQTWNEARNATRDAWHRIEEKLPGDGLAPRRVEEKLPDEPDPRYADFTFYEEDGRTKVSDGQALRAKHRYFLEVAVRMKRDLSGIPFEGKADRRFIREPMQKKSVKILVVAESDDFEIENPTQTLELPPTGPSTDARFDLSPLQSTPSATDLARIKVSLYYEFNLLEDVVIYSEVLDSFEISADSQLGLEKPIYFQQKKFAREYLDLDRVRPRSMTILIDKTATGYEFRFRFRDDAMRDLVLPARVRLTGTDLEDQIVTIREIWQEIALSEVFTTGVEGTENAFASEMSRLAQAGRILWQKLFLHERDGALSKIGDWLQDHAPERDTIIQIHLDPDASDFVFPWALLYDKQPSKKDYDPVDLEGFWGVRYRIEQQFPKSRPSHDEPVKIAVPLKIGFMLWDQFRNAEKQVKLMTDLIEESAGKLSVSDPPVTNARTCYELLTAGGNQVLYFYSHGYIRSRRQDTGNNSDFGRFFMQRYNQLETASPLRKSLKIVYDSIAQAQSDPKRSFIQLTHGKLYLDDLLELTSLPGEPLVVLNMCESAQRSPLLSESFIHFFLDRGAAAVLGTECPMTVEFAHPFAEAFLHRILGGEEVGEALLQARRLFLKLKNPLGLAYTLYGKDTLAFEPPCISSEKSTREVVNTSS